VKPASKEAKKKKHKFEKSKSFVDEFGIGETERLTHFQKPRPPANRRRPAGVPQPSSTSPKRVEAIKEEEDEVFPLPELAAPKEDKIENDVAKDKKVEAPKLFTPALPTVTLRPKFPVKKEEVPVYDMSSSPMKSRVKQDSLSLESFSRQVRLQPRTGTTFLANIGLA
jgi:hypothetical protein